MNELNEQAFWLELFAVRIRHEERRSAALQANLELLENGHGSGAELSRAPQGPNHVTIVRLPRSSSDIPGGEKNLSKRVWEKEINRAETHSAKKIKSLLLAKDHAMSWLRNTDQDETVLMKTASDRKVVQISTMVHAEKDWAFIALCDDGSLWLYHGSWSRIENIPQTTNT